MIEFVSNKQCYRLMRDATKYSLFNYVNNII